MVDAILCAARASYFGKFMWHRTQPYLAPLFDPQSSHTLDRAVVLASPHVAWGDILDSPEAVSRWSAAVSVVSYSEEIGQSVVDALLQIAAVDSLRPHIPTDIWAWLERQPSLPPVCRGRKGGTWPQIVHHVRLLGDIEILKSYFLLVWSEWRFHSGPSLNEMVTSIKEDFSGIKMRSHRDDLLRRLDHILEQFDRGLEYFKQHYPSLEADIVGQTKSQYEMLMQVLVEMDMGEMKTPACASPELISSSSWNTDPFGLAQDPPLALHPFSVCGLKRGGCHSPRFVRLISSLAFDLLTVPCCSNRRCSHRRILSQFYHQQTSWRGIAFRPFGFFVPILSYHSSYCHILASSHPNLDLRPHVLETLHPQSMIVSVIRGLLEETSVLVGHQCGCSSYAIRSLLFFFLLCGETGTMLGNCTWGTSEASKERFTQFYEIYHELAPGNKLVENSASSNATTVFREPHCFLLEPPTSHSDKGQIILPHFDPAGSASRYHSCNAYILVCNAFGDLWLKPDANFASGPTKIEV